MVNKRITLMPATGGMANFTSLIGQSATDVCSQCLCSSVRERLRYGFDELVVGATAVFNAAMFFTSIRIFVLLSC